MAGYSEVAPLFQCYVERSFSTHEHIVLFEENTASITIDWSWPTWRIPNAKANFTLKTDLPELAEASHLPQRFCHSQRQKHHKEVHGNGISKIKEKLISHLNLNLFVLHDSSLSLSAAHFFIICTTDRRNLPFSINNIK